MESHGCISDSILRKGYEQIKQYRNSTSFFKREVVSRCGSLAILPFSIIGSALDSLAEIVVKLASLGTLGMHKWSYPRIKHYAHAKHAEALAPTIYITLLCVLNPRAKLDHPDGNALITSFVTGKLESLASVHAASDNLLKRYVTSRLTYALLAPSQIITRTADAIIGIGAVFYSFLKLGTDEKVNTFAANQLQLFTCIPDFIVYTTYAINPWTEVFKE
jgi:hypothetical protein